MKTISSIPMQAKLTDIPTEEVQQMLEAATREIERRVRFQKAMALSNIQDITREHGLLFEEVVAAIRTSSRRKKAPAIFRNPSNPRQTWSGKGTPPDWYLDNPNPESLRIPDQ